jgi:hypothetical protein
MALGTKNITHVVRYRPEKKQPHQHLQSRFVFCYPKNVRGSAVSLVAAANIEFEILRPEHFHSGILTNAKGDEHSLARIPLLL